MWLWIAILWPLDTAWPTDYFMGSGALDDDHIVYVPYD